MKPPIRKLTFSLSLLALLLAAAPLEAASNIRGVRRGADTPKSSSSKLQTNSDLKDPNATATDGPDTDTGKIWYFEIIPSYVSTGALLDKFLGASVSFGWRITGEDSVQLELGYFTSNNYSGAYSYTRDGAKGNIKDSLYTYDGWVPDQATGYRVTNQAYQITMNGTITAKATMIPLLITYNSRIKLGSTGRYELRFTPAIGMVVMNDTWTLNSTGAQNIGVTDGITLDRVSPDGSTYENNPDGTATIKRTESFSGKDSNYLAFTMGGGIAFTYYLNARWYVDAGYRYLWTAKASNKTNLATPTGTPWNGFLAWNGMNTHSYSLTLGWKF